MNQADFIRRVNLLIRVLRVGLPASVAAVLLWVGWTADDVFRAFVYGAVPVVGVAVAVSWVVRAINRRAR